MDDTSIQVTAPYRRQRPTDGAGRGSTSHAVLLADGDVRSLRRLRAASSLGLGGAVVGVLVLSAACGARTNGPAAPPDGLVNFGATIEAWSAHHVLDPDFGGDSAYDPDPTLPTLDGHTGARFTFVNAGGDRITMYDFTPPSGTGLAGARRDVATQLPADATSLWFQMKGTCAQEQFTSSTLASALGQDQGATVEYTDTVANGPSVFTGNVVNKVSITVGHAPTPTDAPNC